MTTLYQSRKQESYRIFDQIAATYDRLNRMLSFGIDIYWRRQLVKYLPTQTTPYALLDLATGTADVPLTLAKHKALKNKLARIVGIDMSKGMLKIGQKKVEQAGLGNLIQLHCGDGHNLPVANDAFDATSISFGIRNYSDPLQGLKEMHRVLRPGGRALVLEFSLPKFFLVKWIYLFYFRHLLPWVGNLMSGHKDAYTYLNQTVEDFPYGKDFEALMVQADLKLIKTIPLTFGIANLYVGEKKNG